MGDQDSAPPINRRAVSTSGGNLRRHVPSRREERVGAAAVTPWLELARRMPKRLHVVNTLDRLRTNRLIACAPTNRAA
jgi:hypothetical protein